MSDNNEDRPNMPPLFPEEEPHRKPIFDMSGLEYDERYFELNGWGTDRTDITKNMNKFYGVVTIDGKTTIPHKRSDGQWEFMNQADLALRFANKNIQIDEKLVSLDKVWLRNAYRRDVESVIFDPRRTNDDPRIINFWNKFPTVAQQGNCVIILDYYRHVIASGNEEHYNFILDVLAHLVQKPWEKLEIAVVLTGLKGVGKTKFYEIIVRLIGELYCFQTANPDMVYNRFSKHLMNKLVMMLEEMTWGGDKRHEGMIQDFVSGHTRPVEIKNGPTITVANLLRVFITSNSSWVVPATHDERRYAVLKVSDIHRKDHIYFAALDDQLDSGGTEALMYLLMNRDIRKFNHRSAPVTEGLIDQIIVGLPDLDRYWYNVLRLGQIKKITGEKGIDHDWICVGRRIFYDNYVKNVRKVNPRARILSEDEFGRELRKLVPKVVDGKIVKEKILGKDGVVRGEKIVTLIGEKRIGTDPYRIWCHIFPPLDLCRELMDFRLRSETDWGDVAQWEDAEYDAF
jgi:hypothetical protein